MNQSITIMNERKMSLPLSSAQLGIWFAQQIDPSNPDYNIAGFIEIHGAVDPALFTAAIRQAVADTEAYRIRVIEDVDGPRQIIDPSCEISLPLFDVSSESDPKGAAEAWMKTEMSQPVNLLRGPLRTFALFKTATDRFLWYHRSHQLIMDDFGVSLFAQRVADIYTALANELPRPENPFGSLTLLQEDDAPYRASELFERDRQYWLERLVDRPEPVSLSGRPGVKSGGLLRQTAFLEPSTLDKLRVTGRIAGVSLVSMIIAAVTAYLHRLTGAQDLVLGMPVTGRGKGAARRVPGLVANVLPLRLTVRPRMSLSELARGADDEIFRALRHQRYRLEDMHRDLGLVGNGQSLFGPRVNVTAFDYDLRFAGHHATAHNLADGQPVNDLTIRVYDRPDDHGLRIDFNGNPALYRLDELAQHQRRLLSLLGEIATAPTQSVDRVELLGPEERHQLLNEWNQTEAAYPKNLCLHELFSEQAARTPNAVAVICEGTQLSYGELDARSNRLAHYLCKLGVGPEVVVGLCVERSLEMVIGLLGILKAGGAYLPLDPSYPAERLAHMLADGSVQVLVTQAGLEAVLPTNQARAVRLDTDWPGIEIQPATAPPSGVTADNLAYVLYTSGSTGKPKGILHGHRGVVNYLSFLVRKYGINASDRVLNVSNVSSAPSVRDLFGPLSVGGCAVLVPSAKAKDTASYLQVIEDTPINMMLSGTPSFLRSLCEAAENKKRPALALRSILTNGEALEAGLCARLRTCLGERLSVFNQYGATESSISSAWFAAQDDIDVIPIGQPIQNVRAYVLDGNLQLAPPEVTGELYTVGPGLARGYLKQPGLSAERFVANPYGARGTRMYRTGDLARWRRDGVLEFLGRTDHQVKIRGFRIELGEIETALRRHPAVAQAALIAREDRPADKRLVGYVVLASGQSADAAALRVHLGRTLPDYMVPAAIVLLDALPLTPNGKLDRKALPAPDLSAAANSWQTPRTPQEEILCALFAETLGLPRVGIEDNFFELGGHSLLATRLVSRINTTLNTKLSIGNLFAAPTVTGLGEQLSSNTDRGSLEVILPLRPHGSLSPLFCLHPVTGISWCYAGLLQHLRADYPIYGLQARGLKHPEPLPQTFEQMVRDYLGQIRKIQPSGPYHLLGWSFGGRIAYAVAAELQLQGEEVALLAVLDVYPIDQESPCNTRDERQIVFAHLRNLGQLPAVQLSVIKELLQREGHIPSDFEDRHLLAMSEVFKNNERLIRTFVPPKFKGDLLLFTATQSEPVPERWRSYVSGHIHIHPIACQHVHMMRPGPIAEIGRVLATELEKRRWKVSLKTTQGLDHRSTLDDCDGFVASP